MVTPACEKEGTNDGPGWTNTGSGDKRPAKKKRAPRGMARIPSGCFMMGDHFNEGKKDELPVHKVCFSEDFFMDLHEVTNAEYGECLDAGKCSPPQEESSHTRKSYFRDAAYGDYPVIYVDWKQARNYCEFAGKRLPTEAEWEYAARGGLSGKRYPCGNSISKNDANYYHAEQDPQDTSQAGKYPPNGYGLFDMGGNVGEWTADWYGPDYYKLCADNKTANNPKGPDSGDWRVLRGGSWDYKDDLRTAARDHMFSSMETDNYGFRCARSAPK